MDFSNPSIFLKGIFVSKTQPISKPLTAIFLQRGRLQGPREIQHRPRPHAPVPVGVRVVHLARAAVRQCGHDAVRVGVARGGAGGGGGGGRLGQEGGGGGGSLRGEVLNLAGRGVGGLWNRVGNNSVMSRFEIFELTFDV